MKITIESTTKVVELDTGNGVVQARVWEGETDTGISVHCFITRIAPTIENPPAEITEPFERELLAQRAPSRVIGAIPWRMIL